MSKTGCQGNTQHTYSSILASRVQRWRRKDGTNRVQLFSPQEQYTRTYQCTHPDLSVSLKTVHGFYKGFLRFPDVFPQFSLDLFPFPEARAC
jgi:hypothetical protein